jgi:Tat protein secretion system quality control protein TatD with DNase activity
MAVRRVAEAISQIKGVSLTQVASETTAHANRLFSLGLDEGVYSF